jgi:hypothetical protein
MAKKIGILWFRENAKLHQGVGGVGGHCPCGVSRRRGWRGM